MNLKAKLYLNCFIFIAVDALLLFALFFWVIPSLEKLSYRCLGAQSDAELAQRELGLSSGIKDAAGNFEPLVKKVDNMFVVQDAPSVFFGFLENLAKKYDLSISIFPKNDLKKYADDSWDYSGIQIDLIGESSKIWKFTEELEDSPYLIAIQDIKISRFFGSQSKLSQAKASISLKAYTKP